MRKQLRFAVGVALAAAVGAPAAAEGEACREWWGEHRGWKAEVVRRYLAGAPQRELDAAVFELMQREAWLTSCEQSTERARDGLVGWRLVDRLPEDFAGAVVESLLDRAGFDLGLRSLIGNPAAPPVAALSSPGRRRGSR